MDFGLSTPYWLLGLSVVLLFQEFAVPGVGIFGLGSLIAFLAALYYFLGATSTALTIVGGILIAAIGVFWYVLKNFPDNVFCRRFTLRWTSSTEQGYVSSDNSASLVGATGVATTVLRPAGTARFGDRYLDVVTEGKFLEAGTPLIVVAVEGARIVVRQQEGA